MDWKDLSASVSQLSCIYFSISSIRAIIRFQNATCNNYNNSTTDLTLCDWYVKVKKLSARMLKFQETNLSKYSIKNTGLYLLRILFIMQKTKSCFKTIWCFLAFKLRWSDLNDKDFQMYMNYLLSFWIGLFYRVNWLNHNHRKNI